MTRPDRYTTVSHIGSPFEGAMALVAEIIRERPNLPEGLCTGNPVGRIDLVDAAMERRLHDGQDARQKLRAMCRQCPVREQCPDRADTQPRRRPTQKSSITTEDCFYGHPITGPNRQVRYGSARCLACVRASDRLYSLGKSHDDTLHAELANLLHDALVAGKSTRDVPTPGTQNASRMKREVCSRDHPLTGRNRMPCGRCRACRRANRYIRYHGHSDTGIDALADEYYAQYAAEDLAKESGPHDDGL